MATPTQKTYMASNPTVERKCYLIDAKDKTLGKIATRAAIILRGKHKTTYTPHVDTGDMVVIINAEKFRVTGNKVEDKQYQYYTGYHGGQKTTTLKTLLEKYPEKILRLAINRMIPSGALGNRVRTKLRIYAGDKHPHATQNPIPLDI